MSNAPALYLEDVPKPVWIAGMILGFILFWPIGLAILAYLIWSGKLMCSRNGHSLRSWRARAGLGGSSGNAVFDEYREETLRRLDEESREFRAFVERLRRAKDKEEFDRFMAERSGFTHPTGPATQS